MAVGDEGEQNNQDGCGYGADVEGVATKGTGEPEGEGFLSIFDFDVDDRAWVTPWQTKRVHCVRWCVIVMFLVESFFFPFAS